MSRTVSLLSLQILYEDNHCLGIAKPIGFASAHYQGTKDTLDRLVKEYLKRKYQKPGNVFLGIVHRLDKPVSGVLLFARTSKAARRLSEQFREGTIEKSYWAVVEGKVKPSDGVLEHWLQKDKSAGKVRVVCASTAQARHAVLSFHRRRTIDGQSLLEIRPLTGRSHQIRVQLAAMGHPVFGDSKYGSVHSFEGIALHARTLTFRHPVREERITVTADPPASWYDRFTSLLRAGQS